MPPDFSRDVRCLFGLPFDVVSLSEAEQRIRSAAEQRTPCFLSTPNLNFLIACQSDAAFRDSVIHSDLSVADGMPIVWLSRLLGIPICERVAGSTLFEQLRRVSGKKLSVYFFGGPDGVAEAACRQLAIEDQGMTCVGYESPGFGSIEAMSTDTTIQHINACNADFLVVALGARKGQAWIEHNRHRLNPPVISHLGAVVNFVAGTVRRAPAWVQNIGCEWLWRIREEPGLARRYLSDGMMFLRLLATRALPCAWLLYRHKPGRNQLQTATIDVRDDGAGIVVSLRGPWVHDNLGPLRECFARAVLAGKDVRINLEQTTYVDMSFLGVVLLLFGAQTGVSRRLICDPSHPRIRKIFELAGGEFLLSNKIP